MMKHLFKIALVAILLAGLIVGGVSAIAPTGNFTSNVTLVSSGGSVQFNDTSNNTPTKWSWFFGDEYYNQSWSIVNTRSWDSYANAVARHNGDIIVFSSGFVARSTDSGATYTNLSYNAIPSLSGNYCDMVETSDGTIVLGVGFTAGDGAPYANHTYNSNDGGNTWDIVNSSSGWSYRHGLSMAVLSDDTVLLTAGYGNCPYAYCNDTWISNNKGATWKLQNASSGFSARYMTDLVTLPDDSVIISGGRTTGGSFLRDVWRTADKGLTWNLQNSTPTWTAGMAGPSLFTSNGNLFVAYGYTTDYANKTYISRDRGLTWNDTTSIGVVSISFWPSPLTLSDGSFVIIGYGGTYRMQPVGSSIQNATHTYTGNLGQTFNVSLVSYNSATSNITTKANYITIGSSVIMPIVQWIKSKTFVMFPDSLYFNDTSLNTPTAWNWSFGNGGWYNATDATALNYSYQYKDRGRFFPYLIVSNAAGSNTSATQTVEVIGYQGFELPPNPTIWDWIDVFFTWLENWWYCVLSNCDPPQPIMSTSSVIEDQPLVVGT